MRDEKYALLPSPIAATESTPKAVLVVVDMEAGSGLLSTRSAWENTSEKRKIVSWSIV